MLSDDLNNGLAIENYSETGTPDRSCIQKMSKQIISIGYDIPGNSDLYFRFDNSPSLMDADILLVSPDSIRPQGDWVSFTSSDGGCYNVESSNRYRQKIAHLKKEIADHLGAGKTAFIFLTKEQEDTLATGVSSPRKNENSFSTVKCSNYSFLPINIGRATTASGKHIQFTGNPIFREFHDKHKKYLEYELYVEGDAGAHAIFTGKDRSKILGATYRVGTGHIITLPVLNFDEDEFIETRENEDGRVQEFWSKKGLAFGRTLIRCLIDIDKKLVSESEKTPAPGWSSKSKYLGKKEQDLIDSINDNNEKIKKLASKNERLELDLEEESRLRDLLFEQGKPLERAVINALKILGYEAENFVDGDLELDQVITCPEKYRYIGETEGKDKKDINITKFRQLVDALNADFARDEVTEKAFGILFGNAERLVDPEKRKLDFTVKCKSGAEREQIALVRTIDLFAVAKYQIENDDEEFSKQCRAAIHDGLGKTVVFPETPAT